MTSTADKVENLKVCRKLIEEASSKGAKMVFLPEAFDYVANDKKESVELCESLDGGVMTAMRDVARQCRVWLSLGGFHQKDPQGDVSHLRNSHVIIDDAGHIVEVYDKTHLFDVDIQLNDGKIKEYRESAHTLRGQQILPAVDTPVGKVGLAICYDLRFSEMALALTQQMGAEILTYPSAFTVGSGQAHWEILNRNRAIENQCYVIAAAQVGQHNVNRASYGHAMIVDPWGSIVASCDFEVGVALAEIDLDWLRKIRREMPLDSHRRKDLYGTVLVAAKPSVYADETFSFGPFPVGSSRQFLRTSMSVAFVNLRPVVPGHVLVSPLRSVHRLADLSASEITDLFVTVQRVQKTVESHFNAKSSTVTIQDGPEAGQTVEHLHVHVVPRRKGDFARNDEVYEKLNRCDVDDGRQDRRFEEMESEAESLRRLLASVD